jgi:hypothetical protein
MPQVFAVEHAVKFSRLLGASASASWRATTTTLRQRAIVASRGLLLAAADWLCYESGAGAGCALSEDIPVEGPCSMTCWTMKTPLACVVILLFGSATLRI